VPIRICTLRSAFERMKRGPHRPPLPSAKLESCLRNRIKRLWRAPRLRVHAKVLAHFFLQSRNEVGARHFPQFAIYANIRSAVASTVALQKMQPMYVVPRGLVLWTGALVTNQASTPLLTGQPLRMPSPTAPSTP
jgi:hypothetical protein